MAEYASLSAPGGAGDMSGMVNKCRAATDDGTLCKNRVKEPGLRCRCHIGRSEGVPGARRAKRKTRKTAKKAVKRTAKGTAKKTGNRAPAERGNVPAPRRAPAMRSTRPPRPSPVQAQQRREAEEVAAFCEDVLKDGGPEAIAERAVAHVSDETWQALVRKHKRGGCDDLAKLARAFLTGHERVHAVIGGLVGRLLALCGGPPIARVFAQEVVRRIPLPLDTELIAAARALQIAGIYVCLTGDRELADCACLGDVLRVEGKEQIEKLIHGALGDWGELPSRVPDLEAGA